MRDSIKRTWLRFSYLFASAEAKDRLAQTLIQQEIEYLSDRIVRLTLLLKEPQRLRLQREAELEAERLQRKLHEKRRNPPELTEEEKKERDEWRRNLTKREDCRHLKGATVSRWGVDRYAGNTHGVKDYNVATHTFIDGRTRIWCLNGCGFESWSGDQNWKRAKEMASGSSNRPSSSEGVPG